MNARQTEFMRTNTTARSTDVVFPFHNLFRAPWYRRCGSRGLAARHMPGGTAYVWVLRAPRTGQGAIYSSFSKTMYGGGRMRVCKRHVKPARISSKTVATVLNHIAQW
jgi:hypothetical protein